jgi:UDP-glucose 4-epimerase
MSAERVTVTGGAGFIGSHIVDLLVATGYDVSVVDDLHTGKRENVHPAARFHRVDIRDAAALEQVMAAEKPEAIIHQAAWADVRGSLEDPAGYASVNVIGTLNLLQSARRNGVRKIVFASTGGTIYGDPFELPATESCPPRPLDPYGASKLACEFFMDTFRHNFGLETCALRYGNVYGPRQDPFGEAGVVAIFTGKMLRGAPAIINGDGLQQRDFVYVGDIARANVLALRAGSGIYNLGTGVPTDVNMIFDELARLTAYGQPRRHGPPKAGEVRSTYLDAGRARRELGWIPEVALSEGLGRTVEFFRGGRGA